MNPLITPENMQEVEIYATYEGSCCGVYMTILMPKGMDEESIKLWLESKSHGNKITVRSQT